MDTLEHKVEEALCTELAQALAMIYCRHLGEPQARRTLRTMAQGAPELARQFDELDELHARHPFAELGQGALIVELALLYRHNLQWGSPRSLRQLRRLCKHEPELLRRFDEVERGRG